MRRGMAPMSLPPAEQLHEQVEPHLVRLLGALYCMVNIFKGLVCVLSSLSPKQQLVIGQFGVYRWCTA